MAPDFDPFSGLAVDGDAEQPTRMLRVTPVLESRDDLPQAVVEVVSGPRRGWRYALKPGRSTVGRAPQAAIRVDADGVSRWHCELRVDPDGTVYVADAGSTNGTRLNGAELAGEVRRVIDGDIIGVGDVQLRLTLR